MKTLFSLLIIVLALVSTSAQVINVTSYPDPGVNANISGYVLAANPTQYKIAIVNEIFGTFWSKPTSINPTVRVAADGLFIANFITGGQDACAQRIHLFLVPTNAVVPLVLGDGGIPGELYAIAVAQTAIDRISPSSHFVWSGISWTKKDTGACTWGPGPNYFSKDNVFVDSSNRLHLVISYTNGQWRCPEIISDLSLGYGTYKFYTENMPADLPEAITVGYFTYDDGGPAIGHREIDFEFSNGPVVGRDAPWQYVIQPYTNPGNRYRFSVPSNITTAVQSFLWAPNLLQFGSFESDPVYSGPIHATYGLEMTTDLNWNFQPDYVIGSVQVDIPGTATLHGNAPFHFYSSTYWRAYLSSTSQTSTPSAYQAWNVNNNGIPVHGNEKVHINAWLFNGQAPGDQTNSYEIIVNRFSFEPFNSNAYKSRLSILKAKQDPQTGTTVEMKITVPSD